MNETPVHLATILEVVFYQGVNAALQFTGDGFGIVSYRLANL
jgi:hypothetical protein